MKLRYYSNFKSISEKEYRLEIYTRLANRAEPLLLSSSPMQVEYEGEELYKPLKLSNAIIDVLTGSILKDLYTGENQGVQVRLHNVTDNVLEWFGYLTPNLYSGDYISRLDSLNLEAIDALASLDNIKYTYLSEDSSFSLMFDVLTHIINQADKSFTVPYIYVQKTNRLSKDATNSLLSDIYIQERNFFDEANEPVTFREALEYITAYLGMTAIQWKDGFYLVDYDFLNRGSADFFVYNRATNAMSSKNLLSEVRTVRDVGVSSGSASISLGSVYNKVSVVANLNTISDILPDAFDGKDIINQNADQQKFYEKAETIGDKRNVLLASFWKSKSNYLYKKPYSFDGLATSGVPEVTIDNYNSITSGVYWQKCYSYLEEDGEPSSLSWNDYITFVERNIYLKMDLPILSLNKQNIMLLHGGALIMNIEYKLSGNLLAHDVLKTSDEVYSNTKYGAGFKDTMYPCRLSIGNYYFNGDKWISYNEYAQKQQRGYFKDVSSAVHYAGAKWYKYKDNYGYWRYVTEAEYNTQTGSEKASGICEDNNMYYFTDASGNKVFVEEWYKNECWLKDRFYLVHKNKENDKVFDTANSLTNTVSYKMNLSDGQDGVAIKMPTDIVLTGKITFELYAPNHLGVVPMYRTDQVCATCHAVHISDLSLFYSAENEKVDIYNLSEKGNADIVYTNVISDSNVAEMADIDLFINSNARNISSYSNAATKIGDNFNYLKGIYNPLSNGIFLPEQLLIDKLHRHYSSPKFQYSNELKRNLSILDRVKESSLNKTMLVNCMSIDYANECNRVQLIEV